MRRVEHRVGDLAAFGYLLSLGFILRGIGDWMAGFEITGY
jgi:hypothetical protein